MDSTPSYAPPPDPPPLLTEAQILTLASQGHLQLPISPSLEAQYRTITFAAQAFFDQADDVKRATYPPSDGTEAGYVAIPGEKEYLTLRHGVHPATPLEQRAVELWRDTATLLHRALVDLAHALGIPHAAWESLLDGCLAMPTAADPATPTLLRLFRYAPRAGVADRHTDLGLLTLCVSGQPGLQVLEKTGEGAVWRDAVGPTLLAGKMLRVLSGGRVAAGVHRVVACEEGRSSVVFALRPALTGEIDLGLFGGEGTVAARALWEAVRGSAWNVNEQQGVREKQRRELKERREGKAGTC